MLVVHVVLVAPAVKKNTKKKFLQQKMNFAKWVTDYKQNDQVSLLLEA
jgi:hypothetical protein